MDDIPSVRILRGEAGRAAADPDRPPPHRRAALEAAEGGAAARRGRRGRGDDHDHRGRHRAEARRAPGAFLAEASEVLASSLDYEQTLRNVAELAVPDVADWCAVDLVDEDGDRRPVAVAHVDPERLRAGRAAARLRAASGSNPDAGARTGAPHRASRCCTRRSPTRCSCAAAVDERHLELLRAVGLRSALIVPMRARRPDPGRDDTGQRRVRPRARRVRSRAGRAGRRPRRGRDRELAALQRALADRPDAAAEPAARAAARDPGLRAGERLHPGVREQRGRRRLLRRLGARATAGC